MTQRPTPSSGSQPPRGTRPAVDRHAATMMYLFRVRTLTVAAQGCGDRVYFSQEKQANRLG